MTESGIPCILFIRVIRVIRGLIHPKYARDQPGEVVT
jgi:hypothetical protein